MDIQELYLVPREQVRPKKIRPKTLAIVIHWLANPKQSAEKCRDFFENRTSYGSAQFIIGLKGEIIKCMPEDEIAYHCGSSQIDPGSGKFYTDLARKKFGVYATDYKLKSPNMCTVGIECAHLDWSGVMTEATYSSLQELTRELMIAYGLTKNDVLLHKEIVGWKDCHKFFVDNPDEWVRFKERL